jgi:hypothetical protein
MNEPTTLAGRRASSCLVLAALLAVGCAPGGKSTHLWGNGGLAIAGGSGEGCPFPFDPWGLDVSDGEADRWGWEPDIVPETATPDTPSDAAADLPSDLTDVVSEISPDVPSDGSPDASADAAGADGPAELPLPDVPADAAGADVPADMPADVVSETQSGG